MRARILTSLIALATAGCDGSPPAVDGGTTCLADPDCEDGQFCTGHACDPSAAGADARGCVALPDYDPCDGAVCDEAADVCVGPMNCDADADGVESVACGGTDCDDEDPDRFPGNRERCLGELRDGSPTATHDEDCNPCTVVGVAPDGDADADLYPAGSCVNPWLDDARPIGCDPTLTRIDDAAMTVSGSDCNDDPAMGGESVRPNQVEVCGNRIDDNCDAEIDRAFLYPDVDGDGRGDAEHPGELRACDPGWVFNADDCDDLNERTYLGARELCDRLDNDCSSLGDAAGGLDASEDADDDGHAAIGATCLGPGEMGAPMDALPRDDCDDGDGGTHPGAIDLCDDGIDQNCDGVIDNITQIICDDLDGDGHGTASTRRTLVDCELPMNAVADVCDDCDDGNDTIFPSPGTEPCDRFDNDCSSGGGADASEDVDRDGYAPIGARCVGGFPATDCNDTDGDVHPGATELCDALDSDCSSGGGPALDEDGDMDFHAPVGAMCLGEGEPGAPASAFPRDDCDDARADVHGGRTALEDQAACDGRDNDCDPTTSELASMAGCPNAGFCGEGGACGRRLRVVELDSSRVMTCARYASGEVRCWGTYTTTSPLTTHTLDAPVRVPALEGAVQLGVGEVPTSMAQSTPACALRNDGAYLCWPPAQAATVGTALARPVEIRLGVFHTCARLDDGTVSCFGLNVVGQLGDGTTVSRTTTAAVVPGLTDVRGLALGERHTCALLGDGTVSCWGLNDQGQVGNGALGTNALSPAPVGLSGVRSIHAGPHHTCAVLAAGQVRCWGANESGQLGVPGPAPSASPASPIASLPAVASIDASLRHTCAVLTDGRVMCWGDNAMGALGDGTTTSRSTPAAVAGVAGAVDLALEETASCALELDGEVRCWGDGATSAALEGDLRGVFATDLSTAGTCAVEGSALWCWGANGRGQLGNGTTTASITPTRSGEGVLPAARVLSATLSTSSGFAQWGHACAVVERSPVNEVWCWGSDDRGQMGDGAALPDALSPVRVAFSDPTASPVQVSATRGHTCARMASGELWCWGANSSGELGRGATTPSFDATPARVPGLTGVTDVSTGACTTCVVRTNGASTDVACWGCTGQGQGGPGAAMPIQSSPVPVITVPAGSTLGLGETHACVVTPSGTASCWGSNMNGQLGDGTTANRPTPVAIAGLPPVAQIVGGQQHTCARTNAGDVHCWGLNASGELGDGSRGNRTTPGATPVLSGVTHLAALRHTCAVQSTGATWCWGPNTGGLLGDGTTLDRDVPTLVWGL